jgi:ATP-dependent protease HslVU (ClpYQ) peptidase subunit
VSLRMTRNRARALLDTEDGLISAGSGGRYGWVARRAARSRTGPSTTRACNELYNAGLIDIDAATGRAALTGTGRAAMRRAYTWR